MKNSYGPATATGKNSAGRAYSQGMKKAQWSFVCWRCGGMRAQTKACCTNNDGGVSCPDCCEREMHQMPIERGSRRDRVGGYIVNGNSWGRTLPEAIAKFLESKGRGTV